MLGIVQQTNSNQMPNHKVLDYQKQELLVLVRLLVVGGNMNGTTTASPNVQEFSQMK